MVGYERASLPFSNMKNVPELLWSCVRTHFERSPFDRRPEFLHRQGLGVDVVWQ